MNPAPQSHSFSLGGNVIEFVWQRTSSIPWIPFLPNWISQEVSWISRVVLDEISYFLISTQKGNGGELDQQTLGKSKRINKHLAEPSKASGEIIIFHYTRWWYTYPSEKYESQF